MSLGLGAKWTIGLAGALAVYVGHAYYEDHFSDAAHIRHRCDPVWARAVDDESRMKGIVFRGYASPTPTAVIRWMKAASDLVRVQDSSDCFISSRMQYAANDGYFPAIVDTGDLRGVIDCFATTGDGTCGRGPHFGFVAPASPTAQCVDGSLSYSATRQGTCTSHGGVSQWFG